MNTGTFFGLRRQGWLGVLALVAFAALLMSPLAAWAQEGGGGAPPKEIKSWMEWFIESNGLIGLFILVLSVWMISVLIQLTIQFRMEVAMPPEVAMRCDDMLAQKDFKGIYELVKTDDSFFSRVLNTGISELPSGLAEARDGMERFGESIIVGMDKKISILAVLGTLGPMIGLIGTLSGMIKSFSVIARSGAGLDAGEIAGGISEALLLTFEGVFLSIPAIFFYSYFKNKIATISTAVMLRADEFLRHFAHQARAKSGPAAAAASRPAPPAPPAR